MRNVLPFVAFGCLFSLSYAQAQTPAAPPPTNPALRLELLGLVGRDQAVRKELIAKGVEHPDAALLSRMKAVDAADTARVKAIIRRYGWPSPALVGRDGSEAAFLLVQHADPATQRRMLPLVKRAYQRGGLSGQDYALLLDRVLVGEGRPQVYGTQGQPIKEWKGHEPSLMPIEDEAHVDKRRAAVGLIPLDQYREFLRRMYFPQDQGERSQTSPSAPALPPATKSAVP